MSDRILVLHEGRLTAEIPHDRATEERVMFAATGNVERRDATTPARRPRAAPMSETGATATLAARRDRGALARRDRPPARAQPRRDHVRPGRASSRSRRRSS